MSARRGRPRQRARGRAGLLLALLLATSAVAGDREVAAHQDSDAASAADGDLQTLLRESLIEGGRVPLTAALEQDTVQRLCSLPAGQRDAAALEHMRADEQAQVRYPADGQLLGDWHRGERIARDGGGLQFSDPPGRPAGGNCYACHQIDPREPAYGTLGPSLSRYRALHGSDPAALRRTWVQLYDAQAVAPCSVMPRFGRHGILDEQALRDLMGLLFDPASPVNR